MSAGRTLRRVRENYDRYLDRRRDGPSASAYPLSDVILDGGGGAAQMNLGAPERECLMLFDESLPAFHECSYRSLLHLPAQLLRITQIQVTPDHRHYWAWTAEVLRRGSSSVDVVDGDLKRYILVLVDVAIASLASLPFEPSSREPCDSTAALAAYANPHLFRAVTFSHRAATLMSYLVLEGLSRRICRADVAVDGFVKRGRYVSKIEGGTYHPGDQCNRLSDLLYHFETNVADDETAAALAACRAVISKFDRADHAYLTLQNWRNASAHGGERIPGAEYAVVLTLICLLLWSRLGAAAYQSVDADRYTKAIEISRDGGTGDLNRYYPLPETASLLEPREDANH